MSFSTATHHIYGTIAIDTCVLVDFHNGEETYEAELLDMLMDSKSAFLPPIVISEFLSNPRLDKKTYQFFQDMPQLEIHEEYWLRAGESRRVLLKKGLKAKLGDALIAQVCIDNNAALLTRDEDFKHYEKHCGLRLVGKQ